MQRRIRLSFTSGESVLADLLDEEAPEVCRMVWERLPLDHKLLHGMYSGAEVFALLDDARPAPAENMVHLALPGEILYFYDPGTGATGARKPVAEICLAYDRGVMLRGHEGVPAWASLFARIPGDWKHDWKPFQQACRRVRREGPQVLRIERVE
jgi:hypothetical protein